MATNINVFTISGKAAGDAKTNEFSTFFKLEASQRNGKGRAFVNVNVSGFMKKAAADIKEGDEVRITGRLESYDSKEKGRGYSITQISELKINRGTGSVMTGLLEGRVVKETEPKQTQSGSTVTEFVIACDRTWKAKDGEYRTMASFIPVEVWDDVKLQKGEKIYVADGQIVTGSYTNKEGAKMFTTKVRAESANILSIGLPKAKETEEIRNEEPETAPIEDWMAEFDEDEGLPY